MRMDRDGSEWSRSIPLAKRVSRFFLKMADLGSLLLMLESVDDDFENNDIVEDDDDMSCLVPRAVLCAEVSLI